MTGRIVYCATTKYFVDGREVTSEEFYQAFPPRPMGTFGGHLPSCWPMKPSEALGVHKSQVAEATADAQRKGVPTEFTRDGRPIFTDAGHQRRYFKAYGFHHQHSNNAH